jgi:hypothetical protein
MIKKISIVAMAMVMVVAVQASYACDSAKNASATNATGCTSKQVTEAKAAGASCTASATAASAHCSASKVAKNASAKSCTAEQTAACAKNAGFKQASAQYLCGASRANFAKLAPFGFMETADPAEVHVSVQPTEDGFALVFTGVNDSNVDQAMMLANQSVAALSKPAACEMTRASMVKSAGGCEMTEACLTALANCSVTMVEVQGGAKAVIAASNTDQIQKLHGILATVGASKAPVVSDSE